MRRRDQQHGIVVRTFRELCDELKRRSEKDRQLVVDDVEQRRQNKSGAA